MHFKIQTDNLMRLDEGILCYSLLFPDDVSPPLNFMLSQLLSCFLNCHKKWKIALPSPRRLSWRTKKGTSTRARNVKYKLYHL